MNDRSGMSPPPLVPTSFKGRNGWVNAKVVHDTFYKTSVYARSSLLGLPGRRAHRVPARGPLHDDTRKQGIEETFIVAPERAPAWAQDRSALWNAAEASETRRNSVTGREWELALPSEIGPAERSQIVRDFAQELVSRFGVAVDVAIHAPHCEGDQRNHHAHVLTTTRQLEPEGFTAKTRVLDSAKNGGVEIEQMRGVWAELQNRALERVGEVERVGHRSPVAGGAAGSGAGTRRRARGRGAGPRPGAEAGTGGQFDGAARESLRRARGPGVCPG